MKQSYTSSIKDMPFLYSEMKRTAQLICNGKSKNMILELSLKQNIYQLDKEKRRRELPVRMLKRLETLSFPLISVIADGRDSESKLIAFLALIKSERLFFEYMHEVYEDRYYSGHDISDEDFIVFIEKKAQNDERVAKWTVNTLLQIKNSFKSILCEVNLAKRNGNELTIQKQFIDYEIMKLLREEDKIYAKAMLLDGS